MGGVADFISDIGDAVGDVFEAVGDVVESVVDVVGDVVEKVGDVVQAVIDDPLPVLLSAAGSFVGIPPWVTMSAVTAARGGSLEDIALAGGTAFLGSAVGAGGFTDSISSTFSSTFIEAGVNETFAQVASDSITKGLVNGTIAEVKGGSFEDGFVGGAIGGVVQSGVQDVGSYFKSDIIEFASDNGLDLKDATSVYNATTKAVTAGVTSSITGKNDFATSFANSVVGSGINAGVNSVNSTIDDQFKTAATTWDSVDDGKDPVDLTVTGAGIPDTLVDQVQVSDLGVIANNTTDTVADSAGTDSVVNNTVTTDSIPQGSVTVTGYPSGETISDFEGLLPTANSDSDDAVLADSTITLPSDVTTAATTDAATNEIAPTGGLSLVSNVSQPSDQVATIATDAPVSENLLTAGVSKEEPTGGLNAVAKAVTPEDKFAVSQGLKPTDFTKPLVATVGSLLKSSLTQPKRPTRPATVRPAGGLQTASVKPKVSAPPAKMNVANLIPIQKAVPTNKPTAVAPPKTLASTAKLSPVSNIAGLTSLVKKVG